MQQIARGYITPIVLAFTALLTGCGGSSGSSANSDAKVARLKDAKLLIEHNATDADTGFQGFADHDPWNQLTVSGPNGIAIATVTTEGGLYGFGLTEMFFETHEPANDEMPIPDVLARLPAGGYAYVADLVKGRRAQRDARLTHVIPAGPELVSPDDGQKQLDPGNVTVEWLPVTQSLAGGALTIVGYQVIVEEAAEPVFTEGFYKPVLDVRLPASARKVKLPAEFMRDNTCYKWEVLAIEDSGNQTLSSAEFGTGIGCTGVERPEDETPRVKQAKVLIEHNATDEDTGFQFFADGDPWNERTVSGPGAVEVLRVAPAGSLYNFGLTELFLETNEPPNDKVPIPEALAHLPTGTYTFRGVMTDGSVTRRTASLTYDIPAGPVLTRPADGATDVDVADTIVAWQSVTTDLEGDPLAIVGYQVIVEEVLAAAPFPDSFAKPVFSVYLPSTATQVKVPVAFLRRGTDYSLEVLAIEQSGNQTLSSAAFTTR